ncbi:septal ring lytic transglycosylase RlpA family protein [Swaminathania salitolerans]|nr:septal ring lytic transglycosylase RlpA family protein [Swaminathania salitolerans]
MSKINALKQTGRIRKRICSRIGGVTLLCLAFTPRHGAHAASVPLAHAPAGTTTEADARMAGAAAGGTTIVTAPADRTSLAGHTPWAASVRRALSSRAHRLALASHHVLAWSEHGVASWYGRGLQGHRTSSGARLDGKKLTAAHPSLPLGSKVLVQNEDTGQSVIVTINDRGPFNSRIIDLSHAAAAEIGMLGSGTAHVKLAPIPTGTAIAEDQPLEVAEAEADDTSEQAIDAVSPTVAPRASTSHHAASRHAASAHGASHQQASRRMHGAGAATHSVAQHRTSHRH